MKSIHVSKVSASEVEKHLDKGEILVLPCEDFYALCFSENVFRSAEKYGMFFHEEIFIPSRIEFFSTFCSLSRANVKFVENLFPGPYVVLVKLNDKGTERFRMKEMKVSMPASKIFSELRKGGRELFICPLKRVGGEKISEQGVARSVEDVAEDIKNACKLVVSAGELSGRLPRVFDLRRDLRVLRY